jgi:hypothetical protein
MPPILANYALDANVFIQAHRRHYAFDLCPGFWDCLPLHHAAGRITSIDKVRAELLDGGDADALEHWVRNTAPATLFASTQQPEVSGRFAEMMRWVVSGHYQPEAVSEFAAAADGWLAAYASVHGLTVVTHEEHRPERRNRVPLPTLCLQFGVPYQDTFSMLRDLGSQFVLAP